MPLRVTKVSCPVHGKLFSSTSLTCHLSGSLSPGNFSRTTRGHPHPHPSRHRALGCLINNQEKGKSCSCEETQPSSPRSTQSLEPIRAHGKLIRWCDCVSQPCEGVPQRTRRAGRAYLVGRLRWVLTFFFSAFYLIPYAFLSRKGQGR